MVGTRDILHVDMDAFFASVEQVLAPRLQGKAVIVGGHVDDRSVVASASYEARKFGVKSAMPIAQARRFCPDGVFLRGNFHAYGEFSDRVHDILRRFTPLVEAMSLDDFYLDLTGCRRLHGSPLRAAEKIKETVLSQTGLNVSIGVAANKLVAKVASGLAKPNGVLEVWRGCEAAFLRPLPVEKLPGVGPSTAASLDKFNLTALGEVARVPREMLQRAFGLAGAVLWEYANGRDDSEVDPEVGLPKSIGREQTFPQDTTDHNRVRTMLYYLTERAARQLREERLLARRVTVKVRYADFRTVTSARSLNAPGDHDDVLYEAALERVERLMRQRMGIRLVGVTLSHLTSGEGRQAELFVESDLQRRRRFYRGLDRLRERFGFDIAFVGPSLRLIKEQGDLSREE